MTASRERWLGEVFDWACGELAARADASVSGKEVVRERPWSIVERFDTDRGAFYFKACASGGAHESALLEYLSGRWPRVVITPIAAKPDFGWTLMRDAGLPSRRSGRDPAALWPVLLPAYATIQVASADDVELLLAAGVPDRRLQRLPALLRDLLARQDAIRLDLPDGLASSERDGLLEAVPLLEAECARLTAVGIPEGIDHGDLHDGNVLVDDDRVWLVDWADSSLTHPFCSLLVTLHVMQGDDFDPGSSAALALRDAYLPVWEQFAPRPVLEEAFRASMRIGHVIRALDWDRMLAGAPDDVRASFQPRIARWLRRWYDRREGSVS